MVTGQQRHSIDGVRSTDQKRNNDREEHQRDQGSDQFEKDVREGQPLGGAARSDRRQRGAGRGADVLPDDTARDDAMARGLIGGLHALLATAAEELSLSGGDIDLISKLTFERTEMADDMRADLLARTPPVAPEQRRALVRAAGMYETVVWLLHRCAATFRAGGATGGKRSISPTSIQPSWHQHASGERASAGHVWRTGVR
jgi:hypothetical protein